MAAATQVATRPSPIISSLATFKRPVAAQRFEQGGAVGVVAHQVPVLPHQAVDRTGALGTRCPLVEPLERGGAKLTGQDHPAKAQHVQPLERRRQVVLVDFEGQEPPIELGLGECLLHHVVRRISRGTGGQERTTFEQGLRHDQKLAVESWQLAINVAFRPRRRTCV